MDGFERNKTTVHQVKQLEDGELNYVKTPNAPYSARYRALLAERHQLPVAKHHQEFLDLYQKARVVVLSSDTGSGKTTQIPKFVLYDEITSGLGVICTQPRRIAAKAVSERVAAEMDVDLGDEVGYNVRFDKKTTASTRLQYVTEGILLQEISNDQSLSRYATVIIDEAHERTCNTDLLLALLKQTLRMRHNFKVVIMLAALDAAKFTKYFDNAVHMHVPGRAHPVKLYHLERAGNNYVSAAVRTVKYIHHNRGTGHIMVFLTGEEEIERTCAMIRFECADLNVLLLYSSMPRAMQQRVFEESPARKCIITTNVAETSLTVDGVGFVVDTGLSKQLDFNPRARMDMLTARPISKASANQRADRAGRTQPGECFRLYSKESYENIMPPTTTPEMMQACLTSVVLKLKANGYEDVYGFDYIDKPAPETLLQACGELNDWGYTDEAGKLTTEGKLAAMFPIDPVWFRTIRVACSLGCAAEVLSIASILSNQHSIFLQPTSHREIADIAKQQFAHGLSDHITLLNAYNAFSKELDKKEGNLDLWCFAHFLDRRVLEEVVQLRNQVVKFLRERTDMTPRSNPIEHKDYDTNIRKALAIGFHTQTAMVHGLQGGYKTVHGNVQSLLHPTCVLLEQPHEWVVYHKFLLLRKPYLQVVTAILPEWLVDLPYFNDDRLSKNWNGGVIQKPVKKSLDAARKRALAKK